MRSHTRSTIALVGLMGAGKSSVARLLGERLGARVVDLDAALEAESGTSVAEFFASRGEAAFRSAEADLLERALEEGVEVLACGGGAVLDEKSRGRLRDDCRTVWLAVSPAEAARRVARDGATRPLLAVAPEERIACLLREREALYAEVAEITIDTERSTPDEVADMILVALAGAGG